MHYWEELFWTPSHWWRIWGRYERSTRNKSWGECDLELSFSELICCKSYRSQDFWRNTCWRDSGLNLLENQLTGWNTHFSMLVKEPSRIISPPPHHIFLNISSSSNIAVVMGSAWNGCYSMRKMLSTYRKPCFPVMSSKFLCRKYQLGKSLLISKTTLPLPCQKCRVVCTIIF